MPARRALTAIVQPPRVSASDRRSPSQVPSHSAGVSRVSATSAAASAEHAHADPAPARHGGEGGGALHRLADEAEIVHRPGVEGRVLGRRAGQTLG